MKRGSTQYTGYGAGCERVTCFAKDHFRPSGAHGAAVGRRCHCGERTPRTAVKVRWKKSNPVAYSSAWTAPTDGRTGQSAALHCMDWRWTGMVTMMCKAALFENLACIIDADIVATRHVSGSFHLGRIFHEEIIFTVLVTQCRCGGAMCSACTEAVVRSGG